MRRLLRLFNRQLAALALRNLCLGLVSFMDDEFDRDTSVRRAARPSGGVPQPPWHTNPDEIEHILGDTYGTRTGLSFPGTSRTAMRLEKSEVGDTKISRLSISALTISTSTYNVYTIVLPQSGEVAIRAGGDTVLARPGVGSVHSLDEPNECTYRMPSVVQTLTFSRQSVLRETNRLLGREVIDPPRFVLTAEESVTSGSFRRAVNHYVREVEDPNGVADAAGPALVSAMLTALLLGQPHTYSEELAQPSSWAPREIQSLVAAINDDPLRFAALGDLTAAAGLSVSALSAGFRRHVGAAPMEYVRSVRLARVHAELVAADWAATTSSAVAARWGFHHYGRFAKAYANVFGRTPAETLRAA